VYITIYTEVMLAEYKHKPVSHNHTNEEMWY